MITVEVTQEEYQFIEALRSIPPDLAFIRSSKGYQMAYVLGLVDKFEKEMEEESKAA